MTLSDLLVKEERAVIENAVAPMTANEISKLKVQIRKTRKEADQDRKKNRMRQDSNDNGESSEKYFRVDFEAYHLESRNEAICLMAGDIFNDSAATLIRVFLENSRLADITFPYSGITQD